MAANYWTSTQHNNWEQSKATLTEARRALEEDEHALIQKYPLPERRLLNVYFQQQLAKLGRRLSIRQHVLATAHVYICRYYSKVEIRRTNPFLVMATAFYLACKIEECPQHIRMVVTESRNTWPELIQPDTSKLGECEFSLISELSAQLVIHHPYRALKELQSTISLSAEELALAWTVINDHYATDLPLIRPPHIIAVMAIVIAVIVRPTQPPQPMSGAHISQQLGQQFGQTGGQRGANGQMAAGKAQKLMSWLAQSDVSIEAVIDAVQDLISLYVVMEQYNEKTCKEQLARIARGRGADK